MKQYLDLMRRILDHGTYRPDRTGIGTLSVFGHQMRFDLQEGFPLTTTKKIHLKSVIHELLWFLRGDTNIGYLNTNGVKIWDPWADEDGELGPVYGRQWRSWGLCQDCSLCGGHGELNDAAPGDTSSNSWPCPRCKGTGRASIDQIREVEDTLRYNPNSRRIIVSAWNVGEVDEMALPPCHLLFQFYVANGRLSCQLYQRSADVFIGVPFNIASYSLLTMMMAKVVGLVPGEFIWTGGDCHLYKNHLDLARLQLERDPRPLPTMDLLTTPPHVWDFAHSSDFSLSGYNPHPHIKAKVAV